jgi:DNA excision repair protein ERCC-4
MTSDAGKRLSTNIRRRWVASENAKPTVRHARRCRLRVDSTERQAALLELARNCGEFDVEIGALDVGDYLIATSVVVERKTYADFATSLLDGRLFLQAAALARNPHRPVILLEGPKRVKMPDVHPHALKGALVSLAVMWRLPVIQVRDPEDSLQVLRFLARQIHSSDSGVLPRYDRKPKRLALRRLYVLQGLPGVGPALVNRLLLEFGSVERVFTASEGALIKVRGVGSKKAQRIRALIAGLIPRETLRV